MPQDTLSPERTFRVLRWIARPNAAGTVLGFCDIELPSGLIIKDIRVGVGPKGTFYTMPPADMARDRDGNPMLDEHGKKRWLARVDFRNGEVRTAFQERVLGALRREHPEIFER